MIRNREAGAWNRGFVAVLVAAFAISGRAHAQAPRVGDVQRLTVVTISMQVGSTEKETKQATYTPPPGWYVRSHTVDCTKKTGNSSFSITTVPPDWSWCSEEKAGESYKLLIDLAGQAGDAGLQARYAAERELLLTELHKARSTHHALVVDATVRGEGFLRSGGSLELTVTAELVYVGADEALIRPVVEPPGRVK